MPKCNSSFSTPVRRARFTHWCFLQCLAAACASFVFGSERTALDEYIAKPDPHFAWKLVKTTPGPGGTAYVLELTSQQWLTEKEVDKPIWKHWLTVIKPEDVTSDTALLFITGGSNERPAPDRVDQNLLQIARESKSIVSELRMVPNQPLVFAGETKGRVEDSLIAYTWDKFLRTGDERWPARLPMTKAAVRAMDAVTAFCASEEGGKLKVDKFVAAGGSKRGWTTWSTAAVDKRVVAIVPIVIDLLNVVPSFQHHYGAYGFWAPAVGDYVAMGIMNWMNTPEFAALMKIEEPYEYRDRLTMPKMVINSAGDQFFLPDSTQFYWNDLRGEKYLRYVPNSDHSLKGTDALMTLLAFYDAILRKKEMPQYKWELPGPGKIRVVSKTKPAKVKLWQATNPEARDFRLETLGAKYTSKDLPVNADGVYEATLDVPAKGWTAGFIELTYENKPAPFKFTSGVTVAPNTLPFKDKFVPTNPKQTTSE
jgi:PhoPQ-activated pathogenicity-related protein